MKKLILILFFLVGCSSQVPVNVIQPVPRLGLKDPAPLELKAVEFDVLSEFTWEQKRKESDVHICLTPDNYKNLSENMLNIKHYLILQKKILWSYRDYYEHSPRQ